MPTITEQARDVLKIEAEGILNLTRSLNDQFVEMVDLIFDCKGRLIVGGIGKSGIVGRKIVATLNSTGTRALFLHPVEAMHGDLGIVSQDDIFLALSNSGETDELNILLPSIRNIGCKIIAFTGNSQSTLAAYSDIVINVGVDREACSLGLAPTASTAAQLAMGDALAVVLLNKKGFKPSDFQKFHPAGTLGQRLASEVRDLMFSGEAVPIVSAGTTMESALAEMNRCGFGAVFVIDQDQTMIGIITDGDIRRCVARKKPIHALLAEQVMTANPRRLGPDTPSFDALNMMEQHQITVLPITNDQGKVLGILHLHDILGKGEFKFNGK